MHISVCRT